MKKLVQSISLFSAYLCLVVVMGCSKKDTAPTPQNCSDNATKVTAAATAYGTNPTKANCEAYKIAVRDFYKSCQAFYTGAQKEALDEFLAEPCP